MADYSGKDPNIFQTALRQLPKPITTPDDVDSHLPDTNNRYRNRFRIAARSLPATGLSLQDYYPGSVASPVRLDTLNNPYWGSLPVITGGESLFPEAVLQSRHAYANAMDLAANQEREKLKDAVFAKYAQEKGSPNYQPVLEEFRNTHVLGFINDQLNSDPDAFLRDWNNGGKTRQELDTRYAIYDAAARATNTMDTNIEKSKEQITQGHPLGETSRNLQMHYLNGNMNIPQLIQMNPFMQNYQTMKDYLPLIEKYAKSDLQQGIDQGIEVKGKDGKVTRIYQSADGDKFYSEWKRQFTSPEKLKDLTDYMNEQIGVTLDPNYDPKAMAAMLHDFLPDVTTNTIFTSPAYHPPAGEGFKQQQQDQLDLNRYQMVKGKLINGGEIPEVNGVPYKDGQVIKAVVETGTVAAPAAGAPFSSSIQQMQQPAEPILKVTYTSKNKYGLPIQKTDEIPINKNHRNGIQLLNKMFNFNREGTPQFVNPESMNAKFDADPDFSEEWTNPQNQQAAPQSQKTNQETDPLGLFK